MLNTYNKLMFWIFGRATDDSFHRGRIQIHHAQRSTNLNVTIADISIDIFFITTQRRVSLSQCRRLSVLIEFREHAVVLVSTPL